ncbi:MAG TPA: TetR family transcriptional regulator [Herpetosiphonaceae bacterium]|nr:TetR family transcriptional regulator [Herpetosiphonaceae bacterium]
MSKRRAMRDDQKQERRQAILDIAWDLFQRTAYNDIAITSVAEQAGLAKGTIYLYFKTKEELFLAVQRQQFEAWFADLDRRLEAAQGGDDIPALAGLMCAALEARPGMTRLMAILHTVLERNIDFATALDFKQMLHARLLRSGALLEGCLPWLDAGDGARLLMQAHALVIGLRHVADAAPVVREVLAATDMAIFEVEFAPAFASTLRALIYGFNHEKRRNQA